MFCTPKEQDTCCPYCGSKNLAIIETAYMDRDNIIHKSNCYECGNCYEQWQDGLMFKEMMQNFRKEKGE